MKRWRKGRALRGGCAGGLLAVLLGMAAPTVWSDPVDPRQTAALFRTVATELDLGGDLFFFFRTEDLLRDLVGEAREIAALFAGLEDTEAAARGVSTTLERLDAFLRTHGLYDGTAIGFSSRSRGDGLYDQKSFLARRPASPDPLFWRMLGGAPREPRVLSLLPSDAAMVIMSDLRPVDLWAFLQAAVREVGGEEAFASLRGGVDGLRESSGIEIDALVGSLGGEMAVSIQLSRDATVSIPMGGGRTTLPAPSLLFALTANNDALLQTIARQAEKAGMPTETLRAHGEAFLAGPLLPDMPFPVRPSIAQVDGVLLIASHPDAIADAIAALRGGNGLQADPEFQALAGTLPARHSGLTYVSARFQPALMALQRGGLAQNGDDPEAALMAALTERIQQWGGQGAALGVRIVQPHGILWHSVTPTGGRELVLAAAAAPLGMLTAIAVPSFVAARGRAQENMLINTLRMVDAAKEQWAMEHNRNEGAMVTEADIAVYLRPGTIALPPGHTLRINSIGKSPEIVRPDGSVLRLPW